MNDVMKYDIEPNPEYERAIEEQKLLLLGRLAVGRASAVELISTAPRSSRLMDNFALQSALDELERTEKVRKLYDGSFSSHNNVVTMYEMIRGKDIIAVSSHPSIVATLSKLNERAWKKGDINLLDATEWCLRTILEKADIHVKEGSLEIDLAEIRTRMLDDLEDEGIEKWEQAFDAAAGRAHMIFQPHPDSK